MMQAAFFLLLAMLAAGLPAAQGADVVPAEGCAAAPFGDDMPALDGWATGPWWTKEAKGCPFPLTVPRDAVIAFAIYCVDVPPAGGDATLKLTAQLFPLKPGETMEASLEVDRGNGWEPVATSPVRYPGWDAHFRVNGWDASRTIPYRVRHGEPAVFAGSIRRDPREKERISVGVMSCNS